MQDGRINREDIIGTPIEEDLSYGSTRAGTTHFGGDKELMTILGITGREVKRCKIY